MFMVESDQIVCKFKFICDKKWDDLQIINGQDFIRYCDECLQPVFYTKTYAELIDNVSKERCVVIVSESDEMQLLGKIMSDDYR